MKAVATAREWLKQRHADLLIGGELLKTDEAVNLWFIGEDTGQNFQATPFRLAANLLKEDFAQAASTALLGIALTKLKPTTEEQGKYLVEILKPVVERLRHLLEGTAGLSKAQAADLQNALGLVLSVIGEQAGDNKALVEATRAYRAALEERTRDRVPLDWAATQMNLGNALMTLGERESGTARLEEAVVADRAALEELTRDRVPLDWAATQMNLGNALTRLGERESGTARLEEAVVADRAALEELTRDRVPLDWAATQMNLGNALTRLGERESGTARLEEAVVAYRAALEERTRDRVPLDWAMTQMNLGNALRRLGEREGGTARLEEAVAAWDAGLTVIKSARAPELVRNIQTSRDKTQAEIVQRTAK
jgi:tetratricopeptide (TPR) repeat protein